MHTASQRIIAATYLRVSLDATGEGLAVERQRQDCIALCEQRGWTPVEYVDNSVSATSRKPRPAYQRMLADIESGTVQAVVVWDLDRLHRRPAELEHFIELADQHRLALATVSGDVDLSTDSGRLMARIKGAVARAEMERKSARQKRAHRQRAEQGRVWTTRRPFGYVLQGGTLAPHPVEAELVRQAYADILAGATQTAIARRWNQAGHLTTVGNRWRQVSLRQLLTNPRNAGIKVYRGQPAGKGDWPPLVSEETWRAAVGMMTHPVAPRTATHLLSGIARCGLCPTGLTVGYTSAGNRIYVCRGCNRIGRSYDRLNMYVTEVTLAYIEAHGDTLLADQQAPDYPRLRDEADLLRLRLEQMATQAADGDLTLSEWKVARDRIKVNLADVESRMEHATTGPILRPLIANPRAVWEGLDVDRRRAVIAALFQVKVNPTRRGSRFRPEDVEIKPVETPGGREVSQQPSPPRNSRSG